MLRRPRDLGLRLRELARRRPKVVEDYLDSHPDAWEELAAADPHDAADILEILPDDAAVDLLQELDQAEAADVLDEMRTDSAADLLATLEPAEAAHLLGEMANDEAADVLAELDPEHARDIERTLDPAVAAQLGLILSYPADAAGGLMKTEVASLPLGLTAGEAIEALRRLHEELDDLSYVYIVDAEHRLAGVLSFRELVFARPGTGLEETMITNPAAVSPETDREEVAELIQRYNLFSLPVIDAEGVLLGMVSIEDVIEAVQQEASEDFALAAGAGAEETVTTAVSRSIRMRLPWMIVGLFLATLVALTVAQLKGTIESAAILAALMPVVALMGGNSGAQSLAVVIRGMAVGDVIRSRPGVVIAKQVAIGAVNGLIIAVLSGALAMLHPDIDYSVALVLALAVFVNMVSAGLAGAGIPILLRKLGRDPALASNIFLTLITDLVGFGGFLLVATLLL